MEGRGFEKINFKEKITVIMTQYQKIYYNLFIIVTIINLSPIKSLAYFSAILFIIPFVFYNRRSNLKLLSILGIYIALYLFYSIIYDSLVTQSFIIGFFTYSSLLPIFIIDSQKIKSEVLLSKIHKFILKVFVFESILGIIQAMYGYTKTGSFDLGNGDFVEGTIHPQLESDSSFANPMYFCNMAGIIIFIIVIFYKYNSQNKISWKYYIGIAAMILASVVHSLLVLIVAFFISYFYISPNFNRQKSKLKSIITFAGIFTFITFSAFFILKDNLSGLWGMADEFNSGSNPRSRLINEFFYQIPNQYSVAPILGLGLGQFTSRANLISSGKYLGRGKLNIPFIVPATSSLSKKYVISKKIELMTDRKSTRLNSSHLDLSRMPSSA